MPRVPHPWQCVYCGKAIADGDGFVELNNTNPDLGSVYGHPIEATPDSWSDPPESPLVLKRGSDWVELVERQRVHNIGFRAFHTECNPQRGEQGYFIPVEKAQSLGQWCSWVVHLREKVWMGRDDLVRMLIYYFTNRGLDPYASGVDPL